MVFGSACFALHYISSVFALRKMSQAMLNFFRRSSSFDEQASVLTIDSMPVSIYKVSFQP